MAPQTTAQLMDGAGMSERMGGSGMMERTMGGGMMDGAAGDGWAMLLPLALLALIVVVVAAAVVALLAYVRRSRSAPTRDETAREVLDRRYATDELSRDEYLRRREDLREPEPESGTRR